MSNIKNLCFDDGSNTVGPPFTLERGVVPFIQQHCFDDLRFTNRRYLTKCSSFKTVKDQRKELQS